MGHHGGDEPSQAMREALQRAMKADKDAGLQEKLAAMEKPAFGATGEYPMGKLDKTDEGEIQFGVTSHRGKVIINFGKPVAWLGMDGPQAIGLAKVLLEHAARCRDIGDEQRSEAKAKEHARHA